MNDSSLNYTGNEIIVPENNLRILEGQLKGAYQLYTFVSKGSQKYSVYGFPTASDIADYTSITDRWLPFKCSWRSEG